MTLKHLCLLLLAVIACIAAQSEDELQIPVENDNQFPPENQLETDETVIEGSGVGAIEEPSDVTTVSNVPIIDDVPVPTTDIFDDATPEEDTSCPKPCVCRIEGESNNFIVDCSGYGLSEFPTAINENTTDLYIQNNKLTEIPKEIALLKNLNVLNAANNSIMNLAAGSISELPELRVLNLDGNRLIEYPQDLKNGFGLTKLEELDLGGNDMRTIPSPEIFMSFKALKKLTLPTTSDDVLAKLCNNLKESLSTICTESCSAQSYECPDAPQPTEDDLMGVVLPGMLTILTGNDDSISVNTESTPEIQDKVVPTISQENIINEISSRAAGIKDFQNVVENLKNLEEHQKSDVEVGATTSETKPGGVDKSVIGMIVAGMVVVVAGIAIKKNWSSIRKRFSSSPRPANDRQAANTNGTSPEEVPLQEKSPV